MSPIVTLSGGPLGGFVIADPGYPTSAERERLARGNVSGWELGAERALEIDAVLPLGGLAGSGGIAIYRRISDEQAVYAGSH